MLEPALPSRGVARAGLALALLCALAVAVASPFLVETVVERRLAAPEDAALWALVGILGFAGFAVASVRPYWAVLVLVATYPITPLGDDTVSEAWKIGASLLLAWAAVVSVVGGWRDFLEVSRTPIGKLLILWSALVTMAAVFGLARGSSSWEILREFVMLQAWVFAIPIAAQCRDTRRLKLMLAVLTVSAVLSAIYYMTQLSDVIVYYRSDLGVAFLRLTFRQAHSFALMLTLALLLWGRFSGLTFLALLGVVVVLLAALVLSLGRSEWFATAVGAFLMLTIAKSAGVGFHILRASLAGVVLALGVFVAQGVLGGTGLGEIGLTDLVAQILQPDAFDQSASDRLDEYPVALDTFARSPLFGHGLGYAIPIETVTLPYGVVVPERHHLHNTALYLSVRMGLLGLGIAAAAFVIATKSLYVAARSANGWESAVYVATLGFLLKLAVLSIVKPSPTTPGEALVVSLVLGIGLVAWMRNRRGPSGIPGETSVALHELRRGQGPTGHRTKAT